MRRIHWEKAGGLLFVAAAFWFLNYNASLQRYQDLIDSCNYTKENVYTPVRKAFEADVNYLTRVLEAASVKQDVKTAADEKKASINNATDSLQSVVDKPCEERFDAPGLFG